MMQDLASRALWRAHRHILSRPPSSTAQHRGPVLVAGLFGSASGIGASARLCAAGFEAAGWTIGRVNLSALFGQQDFDSPVPSTARGQDARTLIVHLNAPEFPRACFALQNWRGSGRRVIGYWAWELPDAPASWQDAARYLTEIWVPSEFTAAAISKLTGKPVRVVPHFIHPPPAPDLETPVPPFEGFTVITFADGKSSFERKNVAGALRAFRQARFAGPARLLLKTRGLTDRPAFAAEVREAIAADPRIELLDANLPAGASRRLIQSADALLSLHRSEGFGLTMAEAMMLGKPVIATGWSGNMEFMDEASALPVAYTLVPAEDRFGVFGGYAHSRWAEPDIADAARKLELLEADPALRHTIGAAGHARVAAFTSGAQYVNALNAGA
ncbi:glycosyltransferase family 4 protein [Hyphomonas sp.]|uniref:glycosyltransferase family 4 protein n=1 Tax=Hyphomonas sp. TaxID=87 RepID=UPI00391CD165